MDNKKYYYLKLKDNYFDQDNVKILESMDNGYIYSLIILKLYLKSLKYNGCLQMTEKIPYDPSNVHILAKVINHDPDHVKKAIKVCSELGMIDIIKSGKIFITEIQNFIGRSSSEADRKRAYRQHIENENGTNVPTIVGHNSDKKALEIEIEKEIEKEIDIKKDKSINFEMKEEYKEIMQEWFEYKKARRETYKNAKSMECCYKKLLNLSDGDIEIATAIIEDAMGSNYKGFGKYNIPNQMNESGNNGKDNNKKAWAIESFELLFNIVQNNHHPSFTDQMKLVEQKLTLNKRADLIPFLKNWGWRFAHPDNEGVLRAQFIDSFMVNQK